MLFARRGLAQNSRQELAAVEETEQSLITDEHRVMIGRKTEPRRHVLTAADVSQVRTVLEDIDPRYAKTTGLAAPYALSILEPRPTSDLPPELTPRVLPTSVLTQTEWTVHRPFRVEEELWATHEVVDLRERLGGRFGRSVLMLVRTEFRTAAGELLAETAHTVTQYDPNGRGPR